MAEEFTEAQRAELRAELRAMFAELRIASGGPPEGPPGGNELAFGSENNENNPASRFRWNSDNLGFFDSFYDSKSVSIEVAIKHAEKEIYFRDIHLFVDRAEEFCVIKGVALIRENLWISLRRIALE